MEILAIVLAAVAVAGAVAIAIYAGKLAKASVVADEAKHKYAELNAAFERLRNEMTQQNGRLEAIIKSLKTEIAKLEGELNEVSDPSFVRDRLRRLLSDPPPGNT